MTDTVSVRERINEELEGDRLHGLTVTRRQEDTVYCVISQSSTWDRVEEGVSLDIPVLDLRTVVVDFEKDTVRVSDNGMWVPQEAGVSEGLTQMLARTTSDLNGATDPDLGPALTSAVEGADAELLLDREIEVEDDTIDGQYLDMMRNHPGIDPSRPWGYGGGPPPEAFDLADRLTEAGLDPSDHLTRLVFGKKEPYQDRSKRYAVEDLKGNYGIELNPEPSGLIAIDVDYPEHFPETELPRTLEVSSPHGDDTQRHILLRCDEKEKIAEELGAWAVQSVEWGDLWIGDRYVVGPGSQLSEYGCSEGDHERGERGGCEACADPDDGYYEVVVDAPIATVEADDVLGLLDESDDYVLRNRPVDPEPPGEATAADGGATAAEGDVEDGEEVEDGRLACDNCDRLREEEKLKTVPIGGEERRVCRGGCE